MHHRLSVKSSQLLEQKSENDLYSADVAVCTLNGIFQPHIHSAVGWLLNFRVSHVLVAGNEGEDVELQTVCRLEGKNLKQRVNRHELPPTDPH